MPNISLDDGIDAARALISKCWFDEVKTEKGVSCLKFYHKEWDEKDKVYKNRPSHDWSSHGSDAFRYLAVGYRPFTAPRPKITGYTRGMPGTGYGKKPLFKSDLI